MGRVRRVARSLVAGMIPIVAGCLDVPPPGGGDPGGVVVAQLMVGSRHSCSIDPGGALWCWGANEQGQLGVGDFEPRGAPTRVGSASDWASVAPGLDGTCGVRTGGALYCWGLDQSSLVEGREAAPVAVDEGRVWQTVPTGTGTLRAGVSGGALLALDGESNVVAQIGVDLDWQLGACGAASCCAVRQEGTLWCWGINDYGQLGVGDRMARTDPVEVTHPVPWTSLAVHDEHSCGVDRDGALFCWGRNGAGAIGDGTTVDALVPAKVAGGYRSVSAGQFSTCAVALDGSGWCWGFNGAGQLGDGTVRVRTAPTAVHGDRSWATIAAGRAHACGIDTDGSAWCWGDNSSGALGRGTIGEKRSPEPIAPEVAWAEISAGSTHTCGIDVDGAAWCWGANSEGRLGDGTRDARLVPTPVVSGPGWTAVAAGGRHTCGLRGGSLYCWGGNDRGQVGDGTTGEVATQLVPIRFGTSSGWTVVATGSESSFAHDVDATFGWGAGLSPTPTSVTGVPAASNTAGHPLHDEFVGVWSGSMYRWTSSTTAELQVGMSEVTEVAIGWQHRCAVDAGELRCAGVNSEGALGVGTLVDSDAYVEVATGGGWTTVSAGTFHTCGIRDDKTLWCWGRSAEGQLGLGELAFALQPVEVVPGTTWERVACGTYYTCAIETGGGLWCWGSNPTGALGDGDGGTPTPTRVAAPAAAR